MAFFLTRCSSLGSCIAILLVALLTAACGDNPPQPTETPLDWPVDEPGPFAVGYSTWEHSYTPAGASESRTIPIHLWYPATEGGGETAVYEFIFGDDQSFVDAPAAAPVHSGGHPVMLYSHGNQGFAGSSPFLMRHFASHGWVAIAPDHVGNTLSTHQAPRPLSLWLNRPLDLGAALDALEQSPVELAGPTVTDQAVLTGHSFGGYTVWAALGADFDEERIQAMCDEGDFADGSCTPAQVTAFELGGDDPRFVAGVSMAGGAKEDWFGPTGLNAVEEPVFQLSGSRDTGAVTGVWEISEEVEMTWVDIEGGCHQLFALGNCEEVPSEEGFEIINTYALAFARNKLLGDAGTEVLGILDGSIEVSDRATMQIRD